MSIISLKIEFGGGLELLFSNQRIYTVTLPSRVPLNNGTDIDASERPNLMSSNTETKPVDITYLIHHMRDHLLKEREELFMEGTTVYVPTFLPFG
jgi:ubiquitin related modifier 1